MNKINILILLFIFCIYKLAYADENNNSQPHIKYEIEYVTEIYKTNKTSHILNAIILNEELIVKFHITNNIVHNNNSKNIFSPYDSMGIICDEEYRIVTNVSNSSIDCNNRWSWWYFNPISTNEINELKNILFISEMKLRIKDYNRNCDNAINFASLNIDKHCQFRIQNKNISLVAYNDLNNNLLVTQQRIIKVDKRKSKMGRMQIPSLIQISSSRRHDTRDFSISDHIIKNNTYTNTSINNNINNFRFLTTSSHDEIKSAQDPPPSSMQPDEIFEGIAAGFDEESDPASPGAGEIPADPTTAFGFILQTIVTAALGDSVQEMSEELEEHIGKVANELISEHMNEEAFYDGTEGRRRLLSLRKLMVDSGVNVNVADQLLAKHKAKTPPFAIYAIEWLIEILSASITNEIAISYTEMLSGLLHKAIHDHLDNGDVASQITEQVHVTVVAGAKKNLQKTIPLAVQRILPPLIVDNMIHDLTHTMTRSLTHILAPTLTFTLSHTAAEHLACAMCRAHGSWCNQCVAHPDEIYGKIYTADYYASYYTDYYIPRNYQPI